MGGTISTKSNIILANPPKANAAIATGPRIPPKNPNHAPANIEAAITKLSELESILLKKSPILSTLSRRNLTSLARAFLILSNAPPI